nr:unnamed protein product [Callosobruchus analis]
MISAVAAVQTKKMGYLKASKTFSVPRATLFRFVKEKNDSIAEVVDKPIGRKPVLDRDIESQLVDYILVMEGLFYGLIRMDLRRLAYQVAVQNNIENPFREGVAGRYWLKGFLKRHQNILSVRQPTGTSYARANGFTRERMNEFYDNLETIQSTTSFPPSRIFNVDETGLSIVQSKTAKVIARKGKNKSQIQTNLFTEWFEHFLEHVKPSEGSPALLILDGHYSHTKNIDVIELARQHHVTILSLPPHCTHKVQPLDRAFMGSLKTYYSEQIRVFIRENNRPVSPYDIAELFGRAYLKVRLEKLPRMVLKLVAYIRLIETFSRMQITWLLQLNKRKMKIPIFRMSRECLCLQSNHFCTVIILTMSNQVHHLPPLINV